MNKRRRYLAKRRRADRAWATRIWQQLVRRGGLCPTCGNHPMNPLPTCPRCGWTGDLDRAGEECDVVFDNTTRRPIPPAGRPQLASYHAKLGPVVETITVSVDERGDHVCQHGVAMDVHCCGCHNGFIFDRDHECSTFGQQPDYPVARAEADQEADQIEKPELDPD